MNIKPNINTQALPSSKELITKLPTKSLKLAAKYLDMYEDDKHFAKVRFAQDAAVNWAPKIFFVRSLADFAETTFLEFSENFLVYFGGAFLSKNIFEKIFLKNMSKEAKKDISEPIEELLKNKNSTTTKKLLPIKAALALCGLAIPIAEYSLSYVKNLFTLKLFKQADFNNIANLNKEKKEDFIQQQKVKKSAIKHIKIAGGLFAGFLGFASFIATKGKSKKISPEFSKFLQAFSEFILAPGNKIFKNNTKYAAEVNRYFGLSNPRGQLLTCVTAAAFGYTGAAKDRGRQNFLEVAFRLPLVLFYVVTGSELVEKGYKAYLRKKGLCKEILQEEEKNLEKKMPKIIELPKIAEELAAKNNSSTESEFENLLKQKFKIAGVPLLSSLIFMGFFIAGYSKFFTQYRYNKEHKNEISK